MKKILTFLSPLLLVTACYEPYVVDYEYSGIYTAYQYDLRSLIVGEGMEFDFGAVLGGVMDNGKDRNVNFVLDDELLSTDLSVYGGDEAFTAYDGLLGNGKCGTLSQTYVSSAIAASGINQITPLPSSYLKLSNSSKMVIKAGKHTGTVNVKVDSLAVISDENMSVKPYYAIGYRLVSADADTILKSKSFEIIALRLENMFFGNWYHGGKSVTVDAEGNVLSEEAYATKIPGDENTSEVYQLTSATAYSVVTNRLHNDKSGTMTITMTDSGIEVSSPDGKVVDNGSGWNKAKLLQDRKLFLNYSYANADGSTTSVADTLTFRNRIRDGVNEWQDENPDHYQQ